MLSATAVMVDGIDRRHESVLFEKKTTRDHALARKDMKCARNVRPPNHSVILARTYLSIFMKLFTAGSLEAKIMSTFISPKSLFITLFESRVGMSFFK
jgi:hypothetical protein